MTSLEPRFSQRLPDGDDFSRQICDHCGHVAYENPKIIVGSVVLHDGKVLLCRRAIEPRLGYWTIPAGYMELGETPQEGAMREAREEANARLALDGLLAIYTVKHLNQVQLIYRARLASPQFSAGVESLEVKLFGFDEIPWDDIAFPTVGWMLLDIQKVLSGDKGAPFGNPEGKAEPTI
ncbi:MAG: NUDIX domain-containing protein [Notoacmeibacter sp.]